LASLAALSPIRGQTADVLRTRADSLAREWRQANALADLQDTLRLLRSRAGRDTIRVGALTILVNPTPLPVAQAAARAWPVIERLYGPAASSLADLTIVIDALDPDTGAEIPPLGKALQVPWNVEVSALTQLLLNTVSAGATDRALAEWLGGPLLLDSAADRRDAPRVHLQLVTTPSRAVRRCYLGDVGACRDALALSDTADLLARWYDTHERRALVARSYQGYFDRGAEQAEYRACGMGNDLVCLDLLRSLPQGSLARPLDYRARMGLVRLAIHLGGRGAIGRLLAGPDRSVPERVSAAAAVSADSLAGRWLAMVQADRPAPVALPPWGAWIAVGWIAVFAACALRSSRWRAS
jgi:hypothetical protein